MSTVVMWPANCWKTGRNLNSHSVNANIDANRWRKYMDGPAIAITVTLIVMLVGIIGTILPLVPGIPLIFTAMIAYGWYEGFALISAEYLVIMGILAIIAVIADHLAPLIGVKYFGASRYAMIGAVIGFLIGIILFPPFGMIIGALAGAVIGEYYEIEDWPLALKAGLGSVAGFVSGILFQIAIALVMSISFVVKIV